MNTKNIYTKKFSRLGNKPESISDNDLDIIERFVVELCEAAKLCSFIR